MASTFWVGILKFRFRCSGQIAFAKLLDIQVFSEFRDRALPIGMDTIWTAVSYEYGNGRSPIFVAPSCYPKIVIIGVDI